MLKWSTERRQFVGEKLGDAANIVFGALVVGQFIGSAAFSVRVAGLGILGWLVLMGIAAGLKGERR